MTVATRHADSPVGGPTDRQRLHLQLWIGSGALLTFLIVVIGGITRLTQSGLSIVDWNPIMGAIPPLGEEQWDAAFARYRQFPEYVSLRAGMTLDEFRFIYFWEYLHRLVARTIGLVFLIPFLFFWRQGYLDDPRLRRRVLTLFVLGGLQGFLGWFMVMSGLVDLPRVSHYRLAAHLSLALTIFGYCVWLTRDLGRSDRSAFTGLHGDEPLGSARGWVYLLGGLLSLQIVWGAFVAGLDAGFIHNTFPWMGDGLLPPNGLSLAPALRNLTENPVTVQWIHRLLGTLLLLGAAGAALGVRRSRADASARRWSLVFAGLVTVQYGLGVMTLLLHVPVALGVTHQATAVAILGVWLLWLHDSRHPRERTPHHPRVHTTSYPGEGGDPAVRRAEGSVEGVRS
jgi:cytochrome c oxidase assembly protein subunit 15